VARTRSTTGFAGHAVTSNDGDYPSSQCAARSWTPAQSMTEPPTAESPGNLVIEHAQRQAAHLLQYANALADTVASPGLADDPAYQLITRCVSAGIHAALLSGSNEAHVPVLKELIEFAWAMPADNAASTEEWLGVLSDARRRGLQNLAKFCALSDAHAADGSKRAHEGLLHIVGLALASAEVAISLSGLGSPTSAAISALTADTQQDLNEGAGRVKPT
jgi:hypothetical protein